MLSLLVILFGVVSNFVGSESGQKQSVKLLKTMVYIQFNTPLPSPPTVTHCLYVMYISFGKVGRGEEVREKVEGQQYTSIVPSSMGATVHKLGRKYLP
jgi:hypothetical protein